MSLKEAVILRKRCVRGEWLVVHRRIELLRQGHDLVPGAALRAAPSPATIAGCRLSSNALATRSSASRTRGRSLETRRVLRGAEASASQSSIGMETKTGTLRLLRRRVVGAGDGRGYVLGADRLVAPLDVGPRELDQSPVQQGGSRARWRLSCWPAVKTSGVRPWKALTIAPHGVAEPGAVCRLTKVACLVA